VSFDGRKRLLKSLYETKAEFLKTKRLGLPKQSVCHVENEKKETVFRKEEEKLKEGAVAPVVSENSKDAIVNQINGSGSPISLPEDLKPMSAAWSEWLAYRKAKKKPVSERAAIGNFREFQRIGVQRAIAAIHHSIRNDYQGIYEAREFSNSSESREGKVLYKDGVKYDLSGCQC
jgi:hypothetical protein